MSTSTHAITHSERNADEHLSKSKIMSVNYMPPMTNQDTLKHLAACSTCYNAINENAQKRVDLYKTQIRNPRFGN